MIHQCCCYGVEGAPSEGCLGFFELPDDEQPLTFCGDPICPPCMEDVRKTLAALKGKGATLTVEHRDEDQP